MQALHSPEQAAQWLRQRGLSGLCSDNRQLQRNGGFLAWPGARSDARQWVPQALSAGAQACLVEQAQLQDVAWAHDPAWLQQHAGRVGTYLGLKAQGGPIADAFYQHPSQRLDVLAVTGTNGKTSTVWWTAHALQALGQPCAMVGTLGMGLLGDAADSTGWASTGGLTTPDAVALQTALQRFVQQGAKACAIEASSIGLQEQRMAGTQLRVALFTNFSQDHLDYHGSMPAYWDAKARLFGDLSLPAAVVNVDDAKGVQLAASLRQQTPQLDLWTYAVAGDARLTARQLQWASPAAPQTARLQRTLQVVEGGQSVSFSTPLLGDFNISNLLGVMATLRALGHSLQDAVNACMQLPPVPGRMHAVGGTQQVLAVVDYAHTPDALDKALSALRPLAVQRAGALWCVLGCGGDRDRSKRPLMAQMAEQLSDHVVVTSDNPRSEDPQAIAADMCGGMAQPAAAHVQLDRAKAIGWALQMAAPQDVVLIAGKGHETYQESHGHRVPFSDVQVASGWLQQGPAA